MCGIAGILRVHPPTPAGVAGADIPPPEVAIPEAWLDILDESIKHRGPDGAGRFRDRAVRADGSVVDVALVHRRLAIIDPAYGHQPMVSPRGKEGEGLVAVVFNGCIYNHRELRKELQAAGRVFETDHSDTEVLVHGWREWGSRLGGKLEGMFAAAIWDGARGALVLLRDQFGEKPLECMAFAQERLGWIDVFSSSFSSIATLWATGEVSQKPLKPDLLERWLRFGFNNQPPFNDASSSSAGYLGLLESQEWSEYPFGVLSRLPNVRSAAEPGAMAELADQLLAQAVARRLEADVPLGCFLSGGVDSSLVAHYAKRELGQLATFTVRMPDDRYDESKWAAEAARALGTEHHLLECSNNPATDLQSLIRSLGLPFGDSSLLPSFWVSQAARSAVTVALSGDGGDELFLGYERYRAVSLLKKCKWLSLLPTPVLAMGAHPRSRRAKFARLAQAANGDGYFDLISVFPSDMLRELLQHEPTQEAWWAKDDLVGANWWDLQNYLPDDLLRKTDAASMQNALEVRSPFLDSGVAELCFSLNRDVLMPRGQRKGLLRQVARKYLPAEIVDRPKQGFAIPIGEWFRSDYGQMRQLLLDHLNSTEPFGPPSLGIELNQNFIQQMLREHMDRKRDHSQRLYMLLVSPSGPSGSTRCSASLQ
jgi:asparagine synthase (glutamine-hydrolysing)